MCPSLAQRGPACPPRAPGSVLVPLSERSRCPAPYPWRVRLTTHGALVSSEARTATVDEAEESPRGAVGRPDSLFPVGPSSAPASPQARLLAPRLELTQGFPGGKHAGAQEMSPPLWPGPHGPATLHPSLGAPQAQAHTQKVTALGPVQAQPLRAAPRRGLPSPGRPEGATHARVPGSQRRILRLAPGRAHREATSPRPPAPGPHPAEAQAQGGESGRSSGPYNL